tara:strand:+ start:5714 stop:6154 length:441 start_codon:yes stop_codon:yes gene_type:complete
MKHNRTSTISTIIVAIAVAFSATSSFAIGGACSECTGGPKTTDWTGWYTIKTVCGVKLQARYYMKYYRFGTRTESNIQYRYCNHSSNDMTADLSNVILTTVNGQVFNVGGESVLVPAGSAVEGQVFTINTVAPDKLCTHAETLHVR